jgi:hypothetical protein
MAREQEQLPGVMIECIRPHGPNEADVVRAGDRVREQIGKLHSALAITLKFPGAGQYRRIWFDERELEILCHGKGQRAPIPFMEFRFGVEKIHLAWRTFLKQEDDVLRLRGKVRLPRRERVGRLGTVPVSIE